ncbi:MULTISPECIES: bifunctional 2-polyprenyl-6-hydroxyphenol methylase/3-demethylubiquinol 3-O-methyltransferase UbiG [Streptomyces]|jgi:SAM-dependent methyltransferase|uniref:class I SAM-dependent methyltransferase n=1 Tax=Streptomyces TaxID=1883 RepID=UPI00093CCD66|nr:MULTISPECIES: class I SAM-dependent methyltransferase [Streptomyces]MBX9421733.1 methyltransferase domain-containing protein [Streptomyces lateritius]OKJ66047.1 methyltransferase [Streptomyces sp. CB02261]
MREEGSERRPLSAAELFDGLGLAYERAFGHLPAQLAAVDWLTGRLDAGARVLDVGSGTGRPVADLLVRSGCAVTGIDVSGTMVDLARAQVPGARFEQGDVRGFDAPPGSFDAVCAFFPLLMMSRAEAAAALERMAGWLAPGGYLVSATVPADVDGVEIEWMGRPVRVSSFSAEEYLRTLREDCGLDVLHHDVSVFHPDDETAAPEEHLFCYARRPGGRG